MSLWCVWLIFIVLIISVCQALQISAWYRLLQKPCDIIENQLCYNYRYVMDITTKLNPVIRESLKLFEGTSNPNHLTISKANLHFFKNQYIVA